MIFFLVLLLIVTVRCSHCLFGFASSHLLVIMPLTSPSAHAHFVIGRLASGAASEKASCSRLRVCLVPDLSVVTGSWLGSVT